MASTETKIESVSDEVRETAVRVGVLFRHLVSYGDGGQSLREIDELGLSFMQFKAMMELYGYEPEGSPYIQELAEKLGASMPSLSRAVDGLVRKDLLTRSEDLEDRRRRRVALTDSGAEVVNRFFYSRAAGVIEFASSLSEKQRRMFDSAIDPLLERGDFAPIYEKFEQVIRK